MAGYSPTANYQYLRALDGVRAACILSVVATHLRLGGIPFTNVGVTVFFFISGFLITRLMLAEKTASGRISLKNFYIRRWARLGPALVTSLTAATIAFYALNQFVPWDEVSSGLFYYANYYRVELFPGDFLMPVGVLWSLAVEEHYYVAFPLLFSKLSSRLKGFTFVLIALCLASLFWRTVYTILYAKPGFDAVHFYTYVATECRADVILMGAALAIILETDWRNGLLRWLAGPLQFWLGLALLALTIVIRNQFFHSTLRYTLQGLSLLPILLSLLFSERLDWARGIAEWSPLVFIGRISYSLYVWHPIVAFVLASVWVETPTLLQKSIIFAAMIATAATSYHLVELPFVKIRHRFGGKEVFSNRSAA